MNSKRNLIHSLNINMIIGSMRDILFTKPKNSTLC